MSTNLRGEFILRQVYFFTTKIDPINTNVNSPEFYKCQFVFRGISPVGIFDFLVLFTSLTFLYLVKMISEWVLNILGYIFKSVRFSNSPYVVISETEALTK